MLNFSFTCGLDIQVVLRTKDIPKKRDITESWLALILIISQIIQYKQIKIASDYAIFPRNLTLLIVWETSSNFSLL